MHHIKHNIQQDGFSIIPDFLDAEYINELIAELNRHNAFGYSSQTVSDFNLIHSISLVKNLAFAPQLKSLVDELLGEHSFPLNAMILDKTQESNWGLDWHQDLKIAVKCKIETTGYSHWTVESGIVHVVPPREVLDKRLSVRIHLDDCFKDNGAILVAPGSHHKGILDNKTAIEETVSGETRCCKVEKGGIMVMKSLLLHKSPYSASDKKRRVLQIDYAGTALGNGLEWHT